MPLVLTVRTEVSIKNSFCLSWAMW